MERRNWDSKGHSGLAPIVLSTAASLSVCMLLVAFASDNQPSVMMNWGRLEDAQLMHNYRKAVTAGESHTVSSAAHHTMDLAEPGRHAVGGRKSAHPKRSGMEEAVKELKHLREVSASVWPSEAKHARHAPQTSAELLAHYKEISSETMPKSAERSLKTMSAAQELASFKRLSDEVLPSESKSKHSSWHHETSGDMLAHYKQMSAEAMPKAAFKARKPAQTAQQELAHLKRLSARVLAPHARIVHAKAFRRPATVAHPAHPALARRPAVAAHRLAALEETEPRTRTIAGGLEITDIKLGTGPEPQVGDNIKVEYTGKLADGSVFDKGDISFHFGKGQVIRGWDEGLKGMRVGGERDLVIPPELAYGARGTPGGPIPPGATLRFNVRLLAV